MPQIFPRLSQFFEDDDGVLSMHRLILFGTFIIASIIMLWLTFTSAMTMEYFKEYCYTFAVLGMVSKGIDAATTVKTSQTEASKVIAATQQQPPTT